MRRFAFLLYIFLVLGALNCQAQEAIFSDEEYDKLLEGEIVTQTVKREGGTWPESFHYLLLDITPREAMALFSDFNSQASYIEDLLDSKVCKEHSATCFDMAWTAKMPWPYNETKYKTAVKMHKKSSDEYGCSWNGIEAEDWADSDGSINFKNWEGKTLLTYTNWVEPSSWISSLFKGTYVSKTEYSVTLIGKYLQEKAKADPTYLEIRSQTLSEIFNDKD